VTFEEVDFINHKCVFIASSTAISPISLSKGMKRFTAGGSLADIWNCVRSSPGKFREVSADLDDLILKAGRQPSDVKRTLFLPVLCWKDSRDREKTANLIRNVFLSEFASSSTDDIIGVFENFPAVTGNSDEVIEKLRAYEAAGVEEIIIQDFLVNHIEYLEMIAEYILPGFRT
jgi:alkanesulfonate monooxygenase SsuD/methylene tetrahydromethanopterin reductase-like flavin-dependent oxidoreductase (luciferase family)